MNILVTGTSGFIAGRLYEQLAARGHTPIPMDSRAGTSTTDLDGLLRIIEANEVEIIAHLGASCSTSRSLDDPARDFHDNAIGTFNVAEAARRAGNIPVIYTSTIKVKPGADGLIAPLGLSKAVGEDYLMLYRALYGVPFVILRPSTVYGPGQDGTAEAGWVTWFLHAALNRQQITIHGDGTQSRDILHIDDMTTLLIDIVEHFDAYQGRTYDVGGGPDNEVSLWGLLRWLTESDSSGLVGVNYDERLPGDLQRIVTDNTAVTAVRDWRPTTPWEDGVRDTLAWMEAHR